VTYVFPNSSASWASLRRVCITVFVTAHILSVVCYALPHPPPEYRRLLHHSQNVQLELDRALDYFRTTFHLKTPQEEMKTQVLNALDVYLSVYLSLRRPLEPYVEFTGSIQHWNMFAAVPRQPVFLRVDVRPVGSKQFLPYKEFSWESPDYEVTNFRHFKAQSILSYVGPGPTSGEYAQFWARVWNAGHPSLPAEKVRFYFIQFTTPPPERIRAGDSNRDPQTIRQETWGVLRP